MTENERAKELQAALEESSTHNGRLLLAFLLFQFYLLLTVVGTTDLQLLLPESIVKLPLLDVELPLFGFYWVAPALLVILHLNFMIQLLQHARKLYKWDEERKGGAAELLPAFLFNYDILFKTKSLNYYLVRFLSWITLFFSPLAILLFFQIRFADYHHLLTTIWHFILVCLDLLVLLIYWYRIAYPELLDEQYDRFATLIKYYLINNGLTHLRIFKKTPEGRKLFFLPEKSIHPLHAISSGLFPLVSVGWVLLLILLKQDMFDRSIVDKWYFPLIPKIGVQEQTLVASPPSEAIIEVYLMQGKSLDSAWLNHATGLNLRKRDLRFADLYRSKTWKADLRNAKLNGAALVGTELNGANLDSAELNGADLSHTELNGTKLWWAKLNYANLSEAKLDNAELLRAELNGADLTSAELNGANLMRAELNGAYLEEAQLIRAHLKESQLNGATLKLAIMNGVDLEWAELNGADLSDAELNGANLSSAELNGADLFEAQLNGAHLSFAELNGAFLSEVELNGADLSDAELNGANFWNAELNGTYFENASMRGSDRSAGNKIRGSYYETSIDTIWSANWNELKEIATSMQDSALCQQYRDRLREAENFSKKVYPWISTIQKNRVQFIQQRKELACQSSYVAEGMLRQWVGGDSLNLQLQKTIVEKIQQDCPDSLEVIRKRNKRVAAIIDEVLHEKNKSVKKNNMK